VFLQLTWFLIELKNMDKSDLGVDDLDNDYARVCGSMMSFGR